MGYTYALGLTDTDLSLEQQVSIHFSANCYPPVPQLMVPVAIEAINAYNEYDGGKSISLPDGISFRGVDTATAFEIIDQLKLHAWLDGEGE